MYISFYNSVPCWQKGEICLSFFANLALSYHDLSLLSVAGLPMSFMSFSGKQEKCSLEAKGQRKRPIIRSHLKRDFSSI